MADVKVPGGLGDPSHILNGINPDGLVGGIDLPPSAPKAARTC